MRLVSTTLAGPGTAPVIGDALRSVAPIVDSALVVWTAPDPEMPGPFLDALDSIDAADLDILSVQYWAWRDHFGEARNASLDFASETDADWQVVIDTDERIVCPNPFLVRAFLADIDPQVQVVVAFAADGSHGRERFFRLPARHRWTGRTHEAFSVDPGEQAIIPPDLITWGELPKDAARLRAKNERDVILLRAEVADHTDDARWRYYLAGALAGIGQNDEAIEAYREAADRDHDETGAMACVRAGVLLADAKRYEEVIAVCARGLTMRADVAELSWMAAGASYNLGRLYQAEAFALLAKVHGEAGPGRGAIGRRVSAMAPHALRGGPDEVLRLVAQARGQERPPLTPDPSPVRITVTSTGYHVPARIVRRCINSVESQGAPASHVYVAADGETMRIMPNRSGRADLPMVDGRGKGLLANLLPIWRAMPDDEVIVWLDGDDWLATDRALATVAAAHQAGAWVTYGSFITSDGRMGFAAPVHGPPRRAPWTATHLKTFRAGLVKRIRDEHLRGVDGEYLTVGIDQAIMLPLLEMAAERAAFVPEVLAIYNVAHSFAANASAEDAARERAAVARVRRFPAYARIERLDK